MALGQPAIFRPKNPATRKQGHMTDVGAKAFEAARKRLAKLAGRKKVSDGDVFEFLARGEDDTRMYLESKQP
jgi:hypothetical protein